MGIRKVYRYGRRSELDSSVMGYNLYITRAKHWLESKGTEIAIVEWVALLDSDQSLASDADNWDDLHGVWWKGHPDGSNGFFYYDDGNIVIKNPDEPSIDKMVEMARRLDGKVQGDDGEIYSGGSVPPRQPELSLTEKVAAFFSSLKWRPKPRPKVEHDIWFKVGDRVRFLHRECTIVSIDPNAMHGLGEVKSGSMTAIQ